MDASPIDAGTRAALHRVAAHVLARRLHDVTGRLGLRPTVGGFGTPAFGPEGEVVRLSSGALLVERAGRVRALPLAGASLARLAAFVGVDLHAPFAVGHDTPPLGDPDAPLAIEPRSAAALAGWYAFGAAVLDGVLVTAGPEADPAVEQLWPEHFDLATDLAWGAGEEDRVNLGAAPGDKVVPEPYLYVGPWGPQRPGDGAFWNAPFGAVRTRADLAAAPDPLTAGVDFLRRGLKLLREP